MNTDKLLEKKKIAEALENDYPLIPMNDIEDEAREIAVRWGGDSGCDWIGDKHKLASDIMNYARRQLEKSGKNLNIPIHISEKDGIITMIDKLPTGITLVYINFDKPNKHYKIYTIDEVIKTLGSNELLANYKMSKNNKQAETKPCTTDMVADLYRKSNSVFFTTEEVKDIKRIRNYFGEHDRTLFEHWAYSYLDNILKRIHTDT